MKLKLAPLLIKPWILLAKELEGKPFSIKSNGSYSNAIPLLHKLLHAQLAEAEVLLVLTARGFMGFTPLKAPSPCIEWSGHALWLCFIYLIKLIGIAQLMGILCQSQFFETKLAV